MKIINMHSLWAPLAAIAAMATFATSAAHAAVDTIYPGDQCVVAPGYSAPPTTTFSGSIGNASPGSLGTGQALILDCPLARDMGSPTGIGFGIVAVIAQNPGAGYPGEPTWGVACTLYGVNISGAGTYWSESWDYQVTTTISPNTQYLSFGRMPANDHYYYRCSIPPKSGTATSYINAYRISQY